MLKYLLYNILFILLAVPLFILSFYNDHGWVFLVIFVNLYVLGLVLASVNICSCFYIDVLCCGERDSNKISLSFDDGPHSEQTPIVLDILMKHNIKAGFFCIGQHAKENPELIKRMDEEGHFIGNHTFSHAFWFVLYSGKKMKEEIKKSNRIILEIIGKRMKLFRPPYGVTNPVLARVIRSTKMLPVGWSLRTLDTSAKGDKNKIMKKLSKVKAGDIVLFHDHSQNLQDILESFILKVKANGMELVRPDELLKINAYE